MKVVRFDRLGPPGEVLYVTEETIGTPSDDELLIHVEASPIHLADLKFISGELPFHSPLPGTPGMEGVGRVLKAGNAAHGWKEGDRVFLPLRVGGFGGWRQQVRLKAEGLLRAPEGDALQLSLIPINPPTSWTMLTKVVDLAPGEWILQDAANSSCGRYLIVLAKRFGFRTVNVVRRESLVAETKALGGDVVLVDGPDLAHRVKKATGGAPIRYAIDAVGSETAGRLAECLAPHGLLLNYGNVTTLPIAVRHNLLYTSGITIRGYMLNHGLAKMSRDEQQAMFDELARLVADGTLSAKIAATYTLEEVHEAVAHAARTGDDRPGKIIVTPNGKP
jgi:NADPH:quinone reductase-like Zn-dependent oxidoreductase